MPKRFATIAQSSPDTGRYVFAQPDVDVEDEELELAVGDGATLTAPPAPEDDAGFDEDDEAGFADDEDEDGALPPVAAEACAMSWRACVSCFVYWLPASALSLCQRAAHLGWRQERARAEKRWWAPSGLSATALTGAELRRPRGRTCDGAGARPRRRVERRKKATHP